MNHGFGSQNVRDTQVEITVRRLTPSARREDLHAFARGFMQMEQRYGKAVANEARDQLFDKFPELALKFAELVPPEIKREAASQLTESLARDLEERGMKAENHIRRVEGYVALSAEALSILDIPDELITPPSAPVPMLSRNPYVHPNSELHGEMLNSWGVASVVISAAHGWMESGDPDVPKGHLKEWVLRSAPTIDFETLFYRSRFDDTALIRLVEAAQEGFTFLAKQITG
jgi:hypothetical protein